MNFLREISVGAVEEMTICATSPNACQSTWYTRQHCKHTMLEKYINNASQKDTTVKELRLSRLRGRTGSDLFPLALCFIFFFSPVVFFNSIPNALGPMEALWSGFISELTLQKWARSIQAFSERRGAVGAL